MYEEGGGQCIIQRYSDIRLLSNSIELLIV